MSILSSFWVVKQYPVNDKTFRFFIGTSQINMLNTLEAASGKKYTSLIVNEIAADKWEATDPLDPKVLYTVYRGDARPPIPEDIEREPYSIRDERIPVARPAKPKPVQLSFI